MHSQVFCALREWETGERITKEFKDYVYQPIYEEFCNHLKGLMATFTEAKKKLAARLKKIAHAGRYAAFLLFMFSTLTLCHCNSQGQESLAWQG